MNPLETENATTTKQSSTKPCSYSMEHIVCCAESATMTGGILVIICEYFGDIRRRDITGVKCIDLSSHEISSNHDITSHQLIPCHKSEYLSHGEGSFLIQFIISRYKFETKGLDFEIHSIGV